MGELVTGGLTGDFETMSLASLRYRTVRLWFVAVGLFALVFTYVAPTVAPLVLLPAPATTVTSLPELAFPSVVFPELAPPRRPGREACAGRARPPRSAAAPRAGRAGAGGTNTRARHRGAHVA